jgi:hypothetical protein
MNIKDATFIRMGFYESGIQTIKDLLARFGNDELAGIIEGRQVYQHNDLWHVRLCVTDWEVVADAFLEHANDAWEASIAAEINDSLRNHGWRH